MMWEYFYHPLSFPEVPIHDVVVFDPPVFFKVIIYDVVVFQPPPFNFSYPSFMMWWYSYHLDTSHFLQVLIHDVVVFMLPSPTPYYTSAPHCRSTPYHEPPTKQQTHGNYGSIWIHMDSHALTGIHM